jgi:thioredoxin reductase
MSAPRSSTTSSPKVDIDSRPFKASRRQRHGLHRDALIIATGAQAKWLGIESEKEFMGYGVSACATCDGFFYRGKDVIVVGGGNSAVEEALYLSNLAKTVTLVHRRDELRSEKILQERLFAQGKRDVMWDTVIDEITRREEQSRAARRGQRRQAEERQDRRSHRNADRRHLRRHRPRAGGVAVRRQAEAEAERLSVDRAGFHATYMCPASSPRATSPTTSTGRP